MTAVRVEEAPEGAVPRPTAWGPRGVRRFQSLRLNHKMLAILAMVSALAVVFNAVMLYLEITPAFRSVEADLVQEQIRRTTYVLQDLDLQMIRGARDYGTWDDDYAFMKSRNETFLKANVNPVSLMSLGMDAMIFIDPEGRWVFARALSADRRDDPSLAARMEAELASSGFLRSGLGRAPFASFIRVGSEIYVVGSAPVLRSDGTGETRGHVMMARRVSAAAISASLRVPAALTPRAQEAISRTTIRSSVAIANAEGRPIDFVTFETPRTITKAGRDVFVLASLNSIGLIAVVLIILTLGFQRLAVNRVVRLETHLRALGRGDALDPAPTGSGDDELDRLVNRFNELLVNLKDARERLIVQSYDQGRSDWASGALHNLRNALNPLTVLFGLWERRDNPLIRRRLLLAVDELAAPGSDPERTQALTDYLVQSVRREVEDAEWRSDQIRAARESLRQVLDILNEQHAPAAHRPIMGPVVLGPLLRSASAVARHSPLGPVRVELADADVMVVGNEVLLSQVLANLFANATEAIFAQPGTDARIEVEVRRRQLEGRPAVEILIKDHGQGVEPADLPRLFERGFSTRKEKVGGLGLHWVANAVNMMGGRIDIQSEGPGKGASARLLLACPPETQALVAA